MHPYLKILNRTVPVYSLCIILGMFAGGSVAVLIAKRFNVSRDDTIYSYIYALLGLVAGAKILYLLLIIKSIPEIISRYGLLPLLQGGFVIYGGIAGAFCGVFIYARQFKMQARPLCSTLITVTPLVQAFGRIGCLFAGCCYGIECAGPICITLNKTKRFPVQILSSVLDFALFIFLLFTSKTKLKTKQVELYAIGYSVIRFFCEFFRGDTDRGFLGPLSTSQWISIIFFSWAVFSLIKFRAKKQTV
ncbi:MAG: prolipoprotein diacylglyceryl transferase [Treponema sp.]|nr:prolipoprotein diacylglyceryl transferase [Treponema sp.]